jgi:hypothetical protein
MRGPLPQKATGTPSDLSAKATSAIKHSETPYA